MVSYLVVDRRDKLREPTKKCITLLFDWNTVGPAASSSPKSKVLRFLLLILFLLCMATFLVKVEILSPNFFSASTFTFWVWGLIFVPKPNAPTPAPTSTPTSIPQAPALHFIASRNHSHCCRSGWNRSRDCSSLRDQQETKARESRT